MHIGLRPVLLLVIAVQYGLPVSHEPANSSSASQLSLAIRLLDGRARPGEPLAVRAVLLSRADTSRVVPVRSPEALLLTGHVRYSVLDAVGQEYAYKFYAAAQAPWLPHETARLDPGDSIYWLQVLVPKYFRGGRHTRFTPRPGTYRLTATLTLPEYTDARRASPGWTVVSDTVTFALVRDRHWSGVIRPFLDILDAGLWNGFLFSNREGINRIVRRLATRRRVGDSSLLYVDYLAPRARARAKDVDAAISEAQRFVADHPLSPLAEEMGFNMLDFLTEPAYRDGAGTARAVQLRQRAESLIVELLRVYPRNTRALSLVQTRNDSGCGGRP